MSLYGCHCELCPVRATSSSIILTNIYYYITTCNIILIMQAYGTAFAFQQLGDRRCAMRAVTSPTGNSLPPLLRTVVLLLDDCYAKSEVKQRTLNAFSIGTHLTTNVSSGLFSPRQDKLIPEARSASFGSSSFASHNARNNPGRESCAGLAHSLSMAISSKNAPLNTQGSRGIPHSDTTPRESAPAVDTAVPHSSTNGARKKRKKKKGKSISVKNEDDHDLELEGEEYAYSDMPVGGMDGFEALDGIMNELKELEPSLTEAFANARNRTSLSPDLESVHLSTTKALNSLGQSNPTIRGTSNGMDSKSLPSSATDQAEMLAELYRNVELSASAASLSNRKMTDRQRLEEVRESMNSLSGTMRTFVQTALSQMADLGLNDSELKQRSIQHIAKDMLENGMGMGVSVGVGIGRGPGTGPNSNGSGRGVDRHSVDDIDLDTLPEAALTQALERLAAGKSTLSSQGIQGEVVVSHEFDGEVFSDEEEGYEEKVDWKLSMTLASRVRPELERKQASQREENGFPKEEREPSEKSSKKSQKNRKRVTKGDIVTVEGHGRESVTREAAQGDPAIAIDDDAAQMPAMPKQPPPPSSRAMGKQPMTYPPPQSTATTHSTPAPPRSARAAAKAPANPQSYQHNHAHHHPSPPASTAPSQQKLRPPAGGTQSKANTNSKLWSTNSTEERERIKEFWLGLSIEERRALVKIEKDAVLKRMKEQQKHSCTCAVCGRKRCVASLSMRTTLLKPSPMHRSIVLSLENFYFSCPYFSETCTLLLGI